MGNHGTQSYVSLQSKDRRAAEETGIFIMAVIDLFLFGKQVFLF